MTPAQDAKQYTINQMNLKGSALPADPKNINNQKYKKNSKKSTLPK